MLRIPAAVLALALGAAACGDGADRPESAPAAPAEAPSTAQAAPTADAAPQSAEPAPSALPSVEVVDVATGATVNLAAFAPSDRPLVLWFWAPH